MTQNRRGLARRAVLVAPLALSGCGIWNGWFGEVKKPIPGKREPVLRPRRGLTVDPTAPKVILPRPVRNAGWPQAGGNPAHLMGNLAAAPRLSEAWRADIGDGGGYRRKVMTQPVVANALVYTMDSNSVVSAFHLSDGRRVWRTDSKARKDHDTSVSGGLAYSQGTLYALNALAELVAFDAAKGTIRWRIGFEAPPRSAPTIADGRLFFVTIEDTLLALAAEDGRKLWDHRATNPETQVLGQPAPAYSNGLVVAGFGSGELACVRADSGNMVWTDELGAAPSTTTLAEFSSIRGRPAISNGRVYAIGLGGLMLGLDLPSGRRLWQRDVAGQDSPWLAGSWMFIVSADQEMAAIDIDQGRVAWVSALPRWNNPKAHNGPIVWWGPALAGDRLVVTSTTGEALAVSPYTGDIIGRQSLPDAAAPMEPVVADGTLLIISDNGRLLALR